MSLQDYYIILYNLWSTNYKTIIRVYESVDHNQLQINGIEKDKQLVCKSYSYLQTCKQGSILSEIILNNSVSTSS